MHATVGERSVQKVPVINGTMQIFGRPVKKRNPMKLAVSSDVEFFIFVAEILPQLDYYACFATYYAF